MLYPLWSSAGCCRRMVRERWRRGSLHQVGGVYYGSHEDVYFDNDRVDAVPVLEWRCLLLAEGWGGRGGAGGRGSLAEAQAWSKADSASAQTCQIWLPSAL